MYIHIVLLGGFCWSPQLVMLLLGGGNPPAPWVLVLLGGVKPPKPFWGYCCCCVSRGLLLIDSFTLLKHASCT